MNPWLRAWMSPSWRSSRSRVTAEGRHWEEIWQKDHGDHPQVKGSGFKLQGKEVGPCSVLKETEASLTWGFLEGGACGLLSTAGGGLETPGGRLRNPRQLGRVRVLSWGLGVGKGRKGTEGDRRGVKPERGPGEAGLEEAVVSLPRGPRACMPQDAQR